MKLEAKIHLDDVADIHSISQKPLIIQEIKTRFRKLTPKHFTKNSSFSTHLTKKIRQHFPSTSKKIEDYFDRTNGFQIFRSNSNQQVKISLIFFTSFSTLFQILFQQHFSHHRFHRTSISLFSNFSQATKNFLFPNTKLSFSLQNLWPPIQLQNLTFIWLIQSLLSKIDTFFLFVFFLNFLVSFFLTIFKCKNSNNQLCIQSNFVHQFHSRRFWRA